MYWPNPNTQCHFGEDVKDCNFNPLQDGVPDIVLGYSVFIAVIGFCFGLVSTVCQWLDSLPIILCREQLEVKEAIAAAEAEAAEAGEGDTAGVPSILRPLIVN